MPKSRQPYLKNIPTLGELVKQYPKSIIKEISKVIPPPLPKTQIKSESTKQDSSLEVILLQQRLFFKKYDYRNVLPLDEYPNVKEGESPYVYLSYEQLGILFPELSEIGRKLIIETMGFDYLDKNDKDIIEKYDKEYGLYPSKKFFMFLLDTIKQRLINILKLENEYNFNDLLHWSGEELTEEVENLELIKKDEKLQKKYDYNRQPPLKYYPTDNSSSPYVSLSYNQLRTIFPTFPSGTLKHIVDNKTFRGLKRDELQLISRIDLNPPRKEFLSILQKINDKLKYISLLGCVEEDLFRLTNYQLLTRIVINEKIKLMNEPLLTSYPIIRKGESPYVFLSYSQLKEFAPPISYVGKLIIIYTRTFKYLSETDKNIIKKIETTKPLFPDRDTFIRELGLIETKRKGGLVGKIMKFFNQ